MGGRGLRDSNLKRRGLWLRNLDKKEMKEKNQS